MEAFDVSLWCNFWQSNVFLFVVFTYNTSSRKAWQKHQVGIVQLVVIEIYRNMFQGTSVIFFSWTIVEVDCHYNESFLHGGSCPNTVLIFYLLLNSRLWFDELLGIWQSCTNSARWEEVGTIKIWNYFLLFVLLLICNSRRQKWMSRRIFLLLASVHPPCFCCVNTL